MTLPIRPRSVVAAVIVAALAGSGAADDKPKPSTPKRPSVMQRKLAHAQKVLEALALEDFDKMRTSATDLQECARETSWMVSTKPNYKTYSNDFVRHLEALKAAAKKRNTDAAALAYVEMTLTCVKCHQFVRDEGIGAAPDLSPVGPKAVAAK